MIRYDIDKALEAYCGARRTLLDYVEQHKDVYWDELGFGDDFVQIASIDGSVISYSLYSIIGPEGTKDGFGDYCTGEHEWVGREAVPIDIFLARYAPRQ